MKRLHRIAGVDEAGRGPLAGPVVAAAVVFGENAMPEGLDDSKRLTGATRERLFDRIRESALAFCIAEANVEEIDRLNILHATMLAMQRAVAGLDGVVPDEVLVDGNRVPPLVAKARAIVGGDAIEPTISAASILAKVHRDRLMLDLDHRFPDYGFARHKGYPTAVHLCALAEHGPCVAHRQSFAPVRRASAERGS